jgi:hypothetical protein
MNKLLLNLTLAGALAVGAVSASATILFYEDFSGSNFVAGNTVAGVTSNSTGALGQGTNAWAIRAGNTVDAVVTNTALSYSSGAISMSGSGKAVTAAPTLNNQSVIFGVNTEMSTWGIAATPAEVGSGNSIYFSMLWRLGGTGNLNFDTTRMGLLNSTNGITGSGGTGYQIGSDNASPARFGASNGTNNTLVLPGTPSNPVTGTTYLLVGRFGSNGTAFDTFDVWLNPTTANGSDTPYFSQTGLTATGGITGFYVSYSNIDTTDAIHLGTTRIGTTWEAVVVPEPSTYAVLLGALALGVVAVRRRMKR